MAMFPSIPEPLVSRQKEGTAMKLLQRGCCGAAFYPQKTPSSPAWEGGRGLLSPPPLLASSQRIF